MRNRIKYVLILFCLSAINLAGKPNKNSANTAENSYSQPTQSTSGSHKQPDTKQGSTESKTPHWYTSPEWVLAIVAVVTLLIVIFQSVQMQTAAQAAKDSVQAVISMERALVEINIGAPSKEIDVETGEEIDDSVSPFQYGIGIINHGRTVARILSYKVWYGCFAKEFSKNSFVHHFENTRHMVLGIRKPAILTNIDIENLLTDWPDILNKTKTGGLRIDVFYEDIIQGKPHRTTVIYRYSVENEGPVRLPQFNEYT